MITGMLVFRGPPQEFGRARGELLGGAIRKNLGLFWKGCNTQGLSRSEALNRAVRGAALLSQGTLEELEGMARGARVPFEEVLAYNRYEDAIYPAGCTALMALGEASATGETIFLKNSDKLGSKTLEGPGYHMNKEINVVVDIQIDGEPRIVGVAAAGSTGLKMGLNDRGVVAGSNLARTKDLDEKRVDVTGMRAIDRAQLLRDGLTQSDAEGAMHLVVGKIASAPMSTPGSIEFVDGRRGFIIEGCYNGFGVEVVREGQVAARANHFILLKDLNGDHDSAGYSRYRRARELLDGNFGAVDREKMIAFSADHANGPGGHSICRHASHFEEESSLSAAVM
ncbi:MAG TPA: C45 family peptidase, partial [Nitrospinota bacterium]|nr:C45 family peptidase [Nitrospinota bacterium]